MRKRIGAEIAVLAVLVAILLGGCGSASPSAGAVLPPSGKSLQFKDGWNFVALGPLDTQSSSTIVSACETNFRPVNNPTEPRAWELGCEAAGAAIARLDSAAGADARRTALAPYPAPAEQKIAP